MGNRQSKKVCANYLYFYDNNADIHNPHKKCFGLKLYPCKNAFNTDKGIFFRRRLAIPKRSIATQVREYPTGCRLWFCETCYEAYYKDHDDPRNMDFINYLSYIQNANEHLYVVDKAMGTIDTDRPYNYNSLRIPFWTLL